MLGEGRDVTPAQAGIHRAALGLSRACAGKVGALARG